jgi:hypothetical protein
MVYHAPAFQLAAFQQQRFSSSFSATNGKIWLEGQVT